MPRPSDPAARILPLWRRLAPLPGGPALFSLLLGRVVPYSGSVRPRVEMLEPGYARVALRDRRRVRNHLHSIHAVALTNVGELASGLAVVTALPPGVRSIVTALETKFHRKARGRLVAEGRAPTDPVDREQERRVHATIHDEEGQLVAEVWATWRLRPEAAP